MVRPALETAAIDGRAYWFVAATSRVPRTSAAAYLLPNCGEYLIAYKDREAVVGSGPAGDGVVRGADSFAHHLVVDGRLAGSWKRTEERLGAR